MKIGLTVSHFDGFRPSKLLRIAQMMGVEFVEFNRSLIEDIEAVARQIGSTASGYHLPLVEEDGFDLSSPAHRREIDTVVESVRNYARRLNLQYALTHPPQPDLAEEGYESSIDYWVENLRRLEVPIVLENVVSWGEPEFTDLIGHLKSELGNQFWGVCFDGPHSFLRGEDIFAHLRSLAPEVRCFHLSDCSATEDLHLPFGQGGAFPIREFLKSMRELQIDGIVNLEINPGSLKNLRHLVESYLLVMKFLRPARYFAVRSSLLWRGPAVRREIRRILATATA